MNSEIEEQIAKGILVGFLKIQNKDENFFVKRFRNEYKRGNVILHVREVGYVHYAEQVTPNWFIFLISGISLLWALLYTSYALYFELSRVSWQLLLVIPGMIVAFVVSTFLPASIFFSTVFLIFSIGIILNLPGSTVSFYVLIFGCSVSFYAILSLMKKASRWYAIFMIKWKALNNDEAFLAMLANGSIYVTVPKHAYDYIYNSEEAAKLILEIDGWVKEYREYKKHMKI